MDGPEFAAILDRQLSNPLLRGLDVACIRLLPEDDNWWSPQTHRVLEVYLYPGPFGADRLSYIDERARNSIERAAAELVGAHEAHLLPAPPVPLRLGEFLMVSGTLTTFFGPLPQLETASLACAATMLLGTSAGLVGRMLHAWMWRELSLPRPTAQRAAGYA